MIRTKISQCICTVENFIYKKFVKAPQVKLIDETINHILTHHTSASRFGDGELMVILGHGIGFQKADPLLRVRLAQILKEGNLKNLIVTVPDIFTDERLALRTEENQIFWRKHLSRHRIDWYRYMDRHQTYYNTAISRFYYPIKNKDKSGEYVLLLKKIWERKNILIVEGENSRLGVGNDLFDHTTSLKRIICPAKNAFDFYARILAEVQWHGKGKLVLIALGPTATVLAADLTLAGLWAIDIGHVDMEYMWMRQQSGGGSPVKGRILNEVDSPQDNTLYIKEEQNYLSSILTRIC